MKKPLRKKNDHSLGLRAKSSARPGLFLSSLIGIVFLGISFIGLALENQLTLQGSAAGFAELPVEPMSSRSTLRFTPNEATQVMGNMLSAIDPARPENSYMPSFMKEKIAWVFAEEKAERLKISGVGSYRKKQNGEDCTWTLIASSRTCQSGHELCIDIFLPRLLEMVISRQKSANRISQKAKNYFALAIVHEAVHLERDHRGQNLDRRYDLMEEDRAWTKVGKLAVKELIRDGQPLDDFFHAADGILQQCGYRTGCPEMLEFVATDKLPD